MSIFDVIIGYALNLLATEFRIILIVSYKATNFWIYEKSYYIENPTTWQVVISCLLSSYMKKEKK